MYATLLYTFLLICLNYINVKSVNFLTYLETFSFLRLSYIKDKFVQFVSNNDKLRNSLIRATYSLLGRRYPITDRHFFGFT